MKSIDKGVTNKKESEYACKICRVQRRYFFKSRIKLSEIRIDHVGW